MSRLTREQIDGLRAQFPAFARRVNGHPAAYFDGPGGTQTPQRVIDAVSHCMAHTNANHEGRFATSRESDAMLHEAHQAMADLLGADDPDCVSFGANMTTITFALARSLARTWQPGDEIVVTRLDHDANFSPWVMAADDVHATVRIVEIQRDDCTLDLADLQEKLCERTKLVAVGCASNSVGTINPVKQIAEWAHRFDAKVFLDAVHYAPHARMDVADWGCDFLACSAYKFFGPHIGVLWGRRQWLEELTAYKVRPASDALPSKWMSGTQNHEGIAGGLEAVNYLADIGRLAANDDRLARPQALDAAFAAITDHEGRLCDRLLGGLADLPQWKVWGIKDPERRAERLPTLAITHDSIPAARAAETLGDEGHFVWDGNYYALNLSETLEQEPDGMVRIGLLHYNTEEEVDRLLESLRRM